MLGTLGIRQRVRRTPQYEEHDTRVFGPGWRDGKASHVHHVPVIVSPWPPHFSAYIAWSWTPGHWHSVSHPRLAKLLSP